MSILSWSIAHPNIAGATAICGSSACIGGAITLSNTGEDATHYLLRYVEDSNKGSGSWSEVMDGKEFKDFPVVQHSYKSLIYGDASYNEGNYLIYYGSEACPHCTGFIFGDQNLARGNLWLKRDSMSNGAWMKAFESTREDSTLKNLNLKFLMFEDVPEIDENKPDQDDYWVLPWARWESNVPLKGRVQGEYKRFDRSAKDFRKVMQAAQERFGEDASGTPTVLVYKKGKPVIFNKTSLPGLDTKKQDESLSDAVELKRFIKHYYTSIE